MKKSRHVRAIITSAIAISLFALLMACGGGGDGSGPLSTATITLAADPTSIYADGYSSTSITATIKDSSGNPVHTGTEVNLSTTLGYFPNGSTSYTETTPVPIVDGKPDPLGTPTGKVSVSLTAGTTAGVAKVTATSSGVSQTIYITMSGSSAGITLTANPASIQADGSSSSIITATLTDASGSPVTPGTTVKFTTDLGTFSNSTTTITVTTPDATGKVAVSLIAGTTAGTATVTATASGVTQSVTVTFTGTVTSITVTATPSTLPANGTSTSDIRAEVKDAQGNPVADGEEITFTITSGTGSISAASDTTSGGFATVTYTAGTTAGSVVIQAMAANFISGSTTITLTSGGVGSITLAAEPTSIPADGSSSSAITAIVKDNAGVPIEEGTLVTFTTSLTGTTFRNETQTITVPIENTAGEVTVSLIAGTTIGTSKITATVSIGTATVTQSIYVKIDVTYSITLWADKTNIKSNNDDTSTITATLVDNTGTAVDDVTLNFSTDNGTLTKPISDPTDPDGQATTGLTVDGGGAGTAVVTCSYQDASSTISITYYAP